MNTVVSLDKIITRNMYNFRNLAFQTHLAHLILSDSHMNSSIFQKLNLALKKDSGCSSDIDLLEQISWMLFLKFLDEQDQSKIVKSGKRSRGILPKEFQWTTWFIQNRGDADSLKEFIDNQLFPFLRRLKNSSNAEGSTRCKIGEIFSDLRNRIHSPSILHESLTLIDQLQIKSAKDTHELASLYEEKINGMGKAGKNGGEYYTPIPLVKAIVRVIDPRIGETVYDGAVGSAGFLIESYVHIKSSKILTPKEFANLSTYSLYGKEKKSLAYFIANMSMILHGIESPNIVHGNTLADSQETNLYNVVLANPPFGSKEDLSVQKHFHIKTTETSILFLQHFIGILKDGGRAGVILKSSFLDSSEKAFVAMRKKLLETCSLHTILLLPNGVFPYANLKTIVIFFEKGKPSKDIWFYRLDDQKKYGRVNAIADSDLSEFQEMAKDKPSTNRSWHIDISKVDKELYKLSFPMPTREKMQKVRTPKQIYDEMQRLESKSHKIMESIRKYL